MANRYWRGNISTTWGTTGNWSSTSPAYTSAAAPTANDDVIFNTDSSTNCVIDGTVAKVCRSFTVNGYTGTISNSSTAGLTIGISTTDASTYTMLSLNPGAGFSITYANAITLQGAGNYTITTNNTVLNSSITISTAGTWTVDSSGGLLTGSTKTLTVNNGTLIANGSNSSGYNISAGFISSIGASARTIRATNIEISGASTTAWNSTGSNLNLRNSANTGAPNIHFTNSTAANRYLVQSATTATPGNLNINNLYIKGNPNGFFIGVNGWANGTIGNCYVSTPSGSTTTGSVLLYSCTVTGVLDFTGISNNTGFQTNGAFNTGGLTLSSVYDITGTSGTIIFNGTGTVIANSKTIPSAVTVNTSGSLTFSDAVTLGSTLTLTAATGGVTANNSLTITGATTHTDGILTLNGTASFAAYTINGGTLNINNNYTGTTFATAGSSTVNTNTTGSIVLSSTFTHGSSTTLTLSKPLSCTTITNNGSGTLSSNTIINTSGLVTITNGTFSIRDVNLNSLTVGASGTLTSSSTATSISITTTSGSNSVTLNGFSTSFLVAGATITGTGFATPVTIVSITNSTTFVVNANANASGTNTVSYSAYTYIAGTYTHTGTATFNKNVYCNVLTLNGGTLTCNENFNFAASSSVTTGTITNTTVTPKALVSNSISTLSGDVTATTATLTLTSGSIIFPYITVGFFNASNANAKTLTTNTVNLIGFNAAAASAYVWNTVSATIGTNFTCTVSSIYLTATPGNGTDYSIFYPGANCPLPNTDIYLQGSGQKGLYACTVRNVYPSGTITIVGFSSATINNDFYCDSNANITFNTTIPWTVGGNFLLPGGTGGGTGSASFGTSPVLTLTNANNNSIVTIGGYLNSSYTSAITLNDANSKVFNFIDKFSSSSTLTLTSGKVRAEKDLTFTTVNLTSGSTDTILLGSGSTGWTTGTGWSGNSTSGFVHTPGNTATLTNSILPSLGAVYSINYTITGATAGSVSINFAGNTTTGLNSSFFKCIISSSNTANLIITPTSDFNGTILVTIQEVSFAVKGNNTNNYNLTASATTFNNDTVYINGNLYCTTLTANNTRLYIDTGKINVGGTTSLNLSYGGYSSYGIYNSTNTAVTITSSSSIIYNMPNAGISYGTSGTTSTLTVSGSANLFMGGTIAPYTLTTSGSANFTILSGGSITPLIATGVGIIIGGATFTMNTGSSLQLTTSNGISISAGTNIFNANVGNLTNFKSLTITGGITTFSKYIPCTIYGNVSVSNGTLNIGTLSNSGNGTITIGTGGIINSYLDGTYLGNGVVSDIISTGSSSWKAKVTVASTSGLEVGQLINGSNGTGALYSGVGFPNTLEISSIIDCYSFEYIVSGLGATPVAGTVTYMYSGSYGQYLLQTNSGILTNTLTATADAILYVEGKLYMGTGALSFTGTSLTIKKYLEYNTASSLTINVTSTSDIYYGINTSTPGNIGNININTNTTYNTYIGTVSIGSTSIPLSQIYTTTAGAVTLGWGGLSINANLSINTWNSDTTVYNSTTEKFLNIRKGVTLIVRGTNYAGTSYYTQYAFNLNNPNRNITPGGVGAGVPLTHISFKGAIIKFTNGTLNTAGTVTAVTYMDSISYTGNNGGIIWFNRQTNNPTYQPITYYNYTANGTNAIYHVGGPVSYEGIWDGEPDWDNKQNYEIVNHSLSIVGGPYPINVEKFNVNGYQTNYAATPPAPVTITITSASQFALYGNSVMNKINPSQSSGVYETYTSGYLEIGTYYKINTIVSCDDFSNVGYVSPGVPFLVTGTPVTSTTFGLTTTYYASPTNWTFGTNVIKLNSLTVGKTYRIDTLTAGDNFLNVGFVAVGLPFIATAAIPTNWTTTTIYELGGEVNINNLNIIYSTVTPGIDSGPTGTTTDTWHAFNASDNNNGTVTCLGWDFVQYRYWVGNGLNWDNTLGWASTSGGTPGASVPTEKTNVIFDGNSGYCNLNISVKCKNFQSLDWSIYGGWYLPNNARTLTINGNAEIGDVFMYQGLIGDIIINSDNKVSTLKFGNGIASGSIPLNNNLVLTAPNFGSIILASNIVQDSTKTIEHRLGTFDTGGYNITTRRFFNTQSTGTAYATIYLRSSNIIITQYTNLAYGWEITNGFCYVNGETSTIKMNDTSNNTIYFRGAATNFQYYNTYNNIIWDRGSSTGGNSMYGYTTINNFTDYGSAAHTLRFEQNANGNVVFIFNNSFNVNGSLGNIITLTTTNTSYVPSFSFNGTGVVICNYVAVSYNYANPNVNVWYTSPVNLGINVTGWNTSAVPTYYKRAMLLGVGGAN